MASNSEIRSFPSPIPSPARWLVLPVSIVLCFAAAGVGGWLTSMSLGPWYDGLVKPTWHPPQSVFGPVWSALYLMMSIAAWLVWSSAPWRETARPLGWFALQLVLNVAWSGLFFALRSPGWGSVEIVLLWLAIAATIVSFHRANRLAAYLLVPYLAWVSFASVLTFTLWRLNSFYVAL